MVGVILVVSVMKLLINNNNSNNSSYYPSAVRMMENQGDSHLFSSLSLPPRSPWQRKQQELGDLMDLSSYLLRPIQRISKYSLLLQDVLALAGPHRPKGATQEALLSPSVYVPDLTSSERERERAELQAAADLVQFQMRHGNDLLTMDAIRECDVGLKTVAAAS